MVHANPAIDAADRPNTPAFALYRIDENSLRCRLRHSRREPQVASLGHHARKLKGKAAVRMHSNRRVI